MCGGCEDEYSVPIISPYLSCVKCTDLLVNGWSIFILREMIPVTLLVIFILILNINFTGGSAKGYIFYSHILAILIPRLWHQSLIIILSYSLNNIDFMIFILPFSIWNLDFLFSPSKYELSDGTMLTLNGLYASHPKWLL